MKKLILILISFLVVFPASHVFAIDDLDIRLEELVPGAQFESRNDEITQWFDSRQQPTREELLAVDVADIKTKEKEKKTAVENRIKNSVFNGMSHDEVIAYIDSSVMDIQTAKEVLKELALLQLAVSQKQGIIKIK